MPPAITAVVFDIGGVFIDWDPRHLYAALIPDPADLDRFLAEVCTPAWNGTLDAGRDFDEACAELAALHPEHADLIHAWKRQEDMILGPVPGTAEVVEDLRAARPDLPIHQLTNMPRFLYDRRVEDFPILKVCDGAVVSGDEGVLKPSPAIFALLTSRFGLDPDTTLFVDDAQVNVDGARAVGFRAHRFVDAPTLRAELTRLGLLP